jgi:hypothetical protein
MKRCVAEKARCGFELELNADSTEIMETQMQSEMLCNFRILELQFS